MNLEQYLQMIGKTEEDFKKDYEGQAKDSVKTRLVLEAVAVDAKIEITEDEMQEKLKELAKAYGKTEEELKDNAELKNYVEENLKMENSSLVQVFQNVIILKGKKNKKSKQFLAFLPGKF